MEGLEEQIRAVFSRTGWDVNVFPTSKSFFVEVFSEKDSDTCVSFRTVSGVSEALEAVEQFEAQFEAQYIEQQTKYAEYLERKVDYINLAKKVVTLENALGSLFDTLEEANRLRDYIQCGKSNLEEILEEEKALKWKAKHSYIQGFEDGQASRSGEG